MQEGNARYRQQQYAEAEALYAEALAIRPSRLDARYNRANTLVRLNRPEEAVKEFDDVAFKATEADLKAKAYYNKGVILSGQQKLEESIEAYKMALRHNPADQQARENLQKALTELKKKKPQQPQPQQPKKQPKKQPQPKMNQNEARQRLKLLEQKEKNVKDRMQKQKSKAGGMEKDW
jgi:tetratricopeptide (TPR) repeat protein